MTRTAIPLLVTTLLVLHHLCFAQIHTTQKSASPPVKDWFLSTGSWQNDPQLYVCEYGSGKDTVVMLHGGWGGDYSGLLTAVRGLENKFHFIFYDQRGSLRSPFPDSLITFEQHIEDVERLRTELKIEKLNLAGHSMGAVLASAYAAKYPARIGRLVLVSPAGLKNRLPDDERILYEKANDRFSIFFKRPAIGKELEKYNLNRSGPPLSSLEETMKFRIQVFSRMVFDVSKAKEFTGDRALYKGNVYELTEKTYPAGGWNYIAEFNNRNYPVTIIEGDHDFVDFGNVLVKKWCDEVPRIRLEVIKDAGHIVWLDKFGEFQEKFAAALVRNSTGNQQR